MVCPLRFVVAGLSALIVLFIAVDLLWWSKPQAEEQDESSRVAGETVRTTAKQPGNMLMDSALGCGM
jgi:uncharacterized protein YpmS